MKLFNKMVDSLKSKEMAIEEIANGNLTLNYQSSSDKDSLGNSIVKFS